jgi:hypothetical protein
MEERQDRGEALLDHHSAGAERANPHDRLPAPGQW